MNDGFHFRDNFNDEFTETFLKLKLFLNFHFNKIPLNYDEFNNIFLTAKKILLNETVFHPFSSVLAEDFSQKIDLFIDENFSIEHLKFETENIVYINFCINLLSVILNLKEYLNNNKDEKWLKIKLKCGYLIKNLSESDLIIRDKPIQKEFSLNNFFNIDFSIHVIGNPINYRDKIIYIFENVKKLLNSLYKSGQENNIHNKLDYDNIILYNNSLIAFIDNILKSELDLSKLLIICYLILKIINYLSLIIDDLYTDFNNK